MEMERIKINEKGMELNSDGKKRGVGGKEAEYTEGVGGAQRKMMMRRSPDSEMRNAPSAAADAAATPLRADNALPVEEEERDEEEEKGDDEGDDEHEDARVGATPSRREEERAVEQRCRAIFHFRRTMFARRSEDKSAIKTELVYIC